MSIPKIRLTRSLGVFSKAACTSRFAPVDLEDVPDARVRGDEWVVVRPTLTGICGSDQKQLLLKGHFDNPISGVISFPHVLGHESVGIVGGFASCARGILSIIAVEAPKRFEWTPIYFKELRVVGSNAFGGEEFRGVRKHAMEHYIDLCASGEVDLSSRVTHR